MTNPQERQAGTPGSTMGYEPAAPGRAYPPAGRHEGEHRGAVVTFTGIAGTLMLLGGIWGIIIGIATLSTNHVYVTSPTTNYTYHWNLTGWGWLEIALGIAVFAAGVSVFLGMLWARILGAALAVMSGIANFMFIPFTPVWSIIMIALDAFIVWALLIPRRVPGQI